MSDYRNTYRDETTHHVINALIGIYLESRTHNNPNRFKRESVIALGASEANTLRRAYDTETTIHAQASKINAAIRRTFESVGNFRATLYTMDTSALPHTESAGIKFPCWVVRAIEALEDGDIKESVLFRATRNLAVEFIQRFNTCLSDIRQRVAERVTAKQERKSAIENRHEVAIRPWIAKAQRTLEQYVSATTRAELPRWEDVSIALALLTGRRMSEIHCTATFEKPTDEDWYVLTVTGQTATPRFAQLYPAWRVGAPPREQCVTFTGRTKGNSVKGTVELFRNTRFTFPVLCDPALIIAAHNKLKEEGKTVTDVELVNRRYAARLSARVREQWLIIPGADADGRAHTTYHTFRGLWFVASLKLHTYAASEYTQTGRYLLLDALEKELRTYTKYVITD